MHCDILSHMMTYASQTFLIVIILWYGCFSFSPILQHRISHDMVQHDHTSMHMVHDMEEAACADSGCVSAPTSDCLKHCLQAAAPTQVPTTALTIFTVVFAILVSFIVLRLLPNIAVARPPDSWYTPLFQFTTVQLRE